MTEEFDGAVRRAIYAAAARERIPLVTEVARALNVPAAEAGAAVRRLAAARALVLQPDGEILMAEPFSAVPTPFLVRAAAGEPRSWFGSCIWDALGIPAMLKIDAEVESSCQCCGQRLTIRIGAGDTLIDGAGVAHVAVPAASWWNDIVFT